MIDLNTCQITNNWRALAYMAKDRIIRAKPDDLNLVLGVIKELHGLFQILIDVFSSALVLKTKLSG